MHAIFKRTVFARFCLQFCVFFGILISLSSFAAIEVHEFDNEVDRLRYQSFIEEMRCPKCQNQNLAGTNAPIAVDLRRELELMIKDGKSDKEIIDFMVERYGEFILLWAAPVVLLVLGVVILLLIVRKRRREEVDTGLSSTERERLAVLLSAAKAQGEIQNKQSGREQIQ
jgi:cytochrome c-type biogenesis protein CcmH